MKFEIWAPATLSNFGPGFDTLGMAVDRYLKVRFESGGGIKENRLELSGSYPAPAQDENLIYKALVKNYKKPFLLSVDNHIPMKRGLGSSSAALACSFALSGLIKLYETGGADVSVDKASLCETIKHAVYGAAALEEGHPDNITPCLFGGFITARVDKKEACFINIPFPSYVEIHLIVPSIETETRMARGILPVSYSLGEIVKNLQNLSFMTANFCLNSSVKEKAPIFYGLKNLFADYIHQDHRLKLCPPCRDAIMILNDSEEIMGAFLSGSGTTICAFSAPGGGGAAIKNAMHIFEAQNILADHYIQRVDYNGLRLF